MGLKPWETDRLTPTQFNGMWKLWKRMNVREGAATLTAPSAAELREAEEAERRYGGGG